MKAKKIPQRMCIGCREGKPKRELIRIVRSASGEFSVDETGKKPGRGAYICPKIDCLSKCIKSHMLERAFSCSVDASIYDKLKEELSSIEQAGGSSGSGS